MFIPHELIREIVEHLYYSAPAKDSKPGRCIKPDWQCFNSLSLASKTYRLITLEVWFRTLFIRLRSDLRVIDDFLPQIKEKWTRHLHCVEIPSIGYMSLGNWDLEGFLRLSRVRLDWIPRTRKSDKWTEGPLKFQNISSAIEELEICGSPWPSPQMLGGIAIFRDLRVLKLRQRRIWCNLCNTCCTPTFKDPKPALIVYEDGLGLPMHYVRALHCLPSLEKVLITVNALNGGSTILGNPKEQNPNIWAGECDRCMEIMYQGDDFSQKWVAMKKGLVVRELQGHTPIPLRPPNLKRVEWHFIDMHKNTGINSDIESSSDGADEEMQDSTGDLSDDSDHVSVDGD